MATDSGHALELLAVDGGLSNSDLCMQTQADLCGIPVDRPAMRETTALGAAYAAGRAVGVEVLGDSGMTRFEPKMDAVKRERMRGDWARAVDMSRGWVRE